MGGLGAEIVESVFSGKVSASRGVVTVGLSAVCCVGVPLLVTTSTGFVTLPFPDAGFAVVLAGVLEDVFAGAFALAVGRDVFSALGAEALVLAVFITSLRLTELSGERNPPVEAGLIRRRILVDNFSISDRAEADRRPRFVRRSYCQTNVRGR
ncbi:hypothetical protein [Nitrobacter winogradskyi]|uniref:Uncharacterized protein n=1 Tax=Nitrobacter winogradskyi TaxID=913 RepID=A0ACC6AIM4_NITWI|nr:hypothetical protein [Nitrobacter winogradskyi]MCP1999534.1 hypothetical protein [Nitrobacter winogradskyi]